MACPCVTVVHSRVSGGPVPCESAILQTSEAIRCPAHRCCHAAHRRGEVPAAPPALPWTRAGPPRIPPGCLLPAAELILRIAHRVEPRYCQGWLVSVLSLPIVQSNCKSWLTSAREVDIRVLTNRRLCFLSIRGSHARREEISRNACMHEMICVFETAAIPSTAYGPSPLRGCVLSPG